MYLKISEDKFVKSDMTPPGRWLGQADQQGVGDKGDSVIIAGPNFQA